MVNERGLPLGIDKSLRLAQTFDTRSAEHVKPLLDSIEEVLGALKKAGIDAFPVYGTLLGAVRGGRLIGHDSDADLGYVSDHTHPVDVVRESFRLQRALADMGYRISRYSGGAFKVDVLEGDGSVRGLDVFGGFLADGNLHLMGEIRTPFRREWIFPLGTTTLEGRELPAPANTDEFLTATYGPSWRVPDPAYKFGTPESTHRRLNGWFRGTRVKRENWDRTYSRLPAEPPVVEPSDFATWVLAQEGGAPERLVDVGCGRGVDDLWFARQGSHVTALDFAIRGSVPVAELAATEDVDLEFRTMNLCELRSVLTESARVAQRPRPQGGHRTSHRGRHRPGRPRLPLAGLRDDAPRRRSAVRRDPGRPRRGRPVRAREPPADAVRTTGGRRARGQGGDHRVAHDDQARESRRHDGAPDRTIGGRMATMRDRLKVRGKAAARNVGRFRAGVQAEGVEALRERVAVLEDEVQECRQLNLRLAELTDVVQELLLPVAQRDEERIADVVEKYSRGL